MFGPYFPTAKNAPCCKFRIGISTGKTPTGLPSHSNCRTERRSACGSPTTTQPTIRNPHNPPQRVQWGYHTYDEMAQVNVDVLPLGADAAQRLHADFVQHDVLAMIDAYEFQLQHHPDDASIRTQLGKDLAATGRLAAGLKQLQKAVELDPDNAKAHYYLARFQDDPGRTEIARKEFEAAIRSNPRFYLALGELGMWHLDRGDFDKAENLFKRSLQIHPADPVVLNNLGILRFRQHNRNEAIRDFRQALSADPNYGPAQDNLRKLESTPSG